MVGGCFVSGSPGNCTKQNFPRPLSVISRSRAPELIFLVPRIRGDPPMMQSGGGLPRFPHPAVTPGTFFRHPNMRDVYLGNQHSQLPEGPESGFPKLKYRFSLFRFHFRLFNFPRARSEGREGRRRSDFRNPRSELGRAGLGWAGRGTEVVDFIDFSDPWDVRWGSCILVIS